MDADRDRRYEVRPLRGLEELRACEAIAKVVWQVDDREIVPASHLRAVQYGGGLVAGAFDRGRQVAFVIGFLARHDGDATTGLHSHLMAVLPDARRAGLGRALKWYQRRWSLERDLPWIAWTFDPLSARHARLNLEHLGAHGVAYEADFYGPLGGASFGGLPTDRLVARWELEAPHVARLAGGGAPAAAPPDAPLALGHGDDEGPGPFRPDLHADAVRIEVPGDAAALLFRRPDRALAWRTAVRDAMTAYLARGYRVRRFHGGAYRLERPDWQVPSYRMETST